MGTALSRDEERVNAAEAAEDGNDADGLILHSHEVSRHCARQVERDGVQQRHAHEDALEEGGAPVHLLLQAGEEQLHFCFEGVGGEGGLVGLLLGGLEHVALRDLRELASADVCVSGGVLSM